MTDEPDLTAQFHLDQQAAEDRQETIWQHQVRDAETTMDQREAVTRQVNAKASLLTTLETLVWLTVALAFVIAAVWGITLLVRGL